MPKRISRPIQIKSLTSELVKVVASVLGTDAVHLGTNSDLGEPRMFIKSGIPDLDIVLDRQGRGWPVGRIVEVYGGEATTKTAIGYALIAQAQKLGGDAILYPSEGNFDEWLADKYGIDGARLTIGDNETVEGIFGSVIPAIKRCGTRGLLIIMIDSVAGMTTAKELEDGVIKQDRCNQIRAAFISKALRKIGALIPRTNVILFCVNQVRDNPDVLFGDKSKPPGGRALKFYASIRLELKHLGRVTGTRAGKKHVSAFKIRITSVKNRLSNPYQEANILVHFEKGLLPLPKKTKKEMTEDDEG